jgi:hypothetical protein
MFERVLKPQSVLILNALLAGEKTLGELSEISGSSKPTIYQKYLKDLESFEIIEKTIVKTRVGREVRYRLRPWTAVISLDPVTGSGIAFSVRSPLDTKRLLLQQVDPKFYSDLIKFFDRYTTDETIVILFGSVASGSGTDKSDIDLLFLKDRWDSGKEAVLDAITDTSFEVFHRINPVFMTIDDFIQSNDALVTEIKKNGMILTGDMNTDGNIWSKVKRYSSITV